MFVDVPLMNWPSKAETTVDEARMKGSGIIAEAYAAAFSSYSEAAERCSCLVFL
eukprot:SAG11_NODE_52_length_19809_cov_14.064231_8_plen_54_part_00